ncbi:hypothetical protein, partial [uncultured Duncaniella sp.]|uniref:hypothetical protein n=1 Tax=uncultured Duncaniella sp. TaxID=2768039 RepID=UPI0026E04DE4
MKKSAMVGSSAFFAGNFGRNAWRSEKSAYLCSDFHLNKATASPTVSAVGYFYSRGSNPISSVPCGALMGQAEIPVHLLKLKILNVK